MKRIIAALICIIMCCTFLCQYVAAEVMKSSYSLSLVNLSKLHVYNGDSLFTTLEVNQSGSRSGNTFTFTDYINLGESSISKYDIIAQFDLTGSWSAFSEVPNEYLYLSIYLDFVSGFPLRFDEFYYSGIKLILPDGTIFDNYFVSPTGDYSYLFSFVCALSQVTFDFSNLTSFSMCLPIDATPNDTATDSDTLFDCTLVFDDIVLTYDMSPITSGDVDMIVNSLDGIDDMLNAIVQNQSVIIDEIIATRDVIDNLPEQLRDLVVGDPYTGNIDTSDLVGYESDKAVVENMIDVDDVNGIFESGLSLDQPGMYDQQSFDAVGGLMTDVIDALNIMPLIILSLSFGLIALVLNRPRG